MQTHLPDTVQCNDCEKEELLFKDLKPFVDTLRSIGDLYSKCCGGVLKEGYQQAILNFTDNWMILHEEFGVSITNKVHIIISHFQDYFDLTGKALGETTDQLTEACHQYVNKKLEDSNNTVKDVTSDSHGKKLMGFVTLMDIM